MIVLIKASIILMVLLAFYKLVLERESFFSSNRFYLLACLVFAVSLPFISLPKLINNQGYVSNILDKQFEPIQETKAISLSDAEPVSKINSSQPTLESKDLEETTFGIEKESSTVQTLDNNQNPINWLLLLYLFGVLVLSINLLAQIVSVLLRAYKADDKINDEGKVIINLEGEIEPCSFFKYIFINPSLYDYDTYDQILNHEKIHVDKRHTIDLIFSEIAVIAFWFNPFVWLLRREIEKNIEYQTDALLIKSDEDIKKSYQLNLVDIASTTRPLAVTTNYNQSLIKQRILKMNGKRSHKFNYWKYSFLLPLLFALLLSLNRPHEIAAMDLAVENNSLLIRDDQVDEQYINENSEESIIHSTDLEKQNSTTQNESDSEGNQNDRQLDNNPPQSEVEEELLPSLTLPESKDVVYTDCKEFEEAVAAGDLNRVKEILKTLDPDCLKIAKGILEEKRDQSISEKDKKNTTGIDRSEKSNCERLELAVDNLDEMKVRSILLNDDVSCLKDIYGEPTRDARLVKGLLSYGAKLWIDKNKIIHIDDIGFVIEVLEDNQDCDDPDFLELSDAIKNADRSRIRKLLTFREFDCPLGEDGLKNDFPFIKELMTYRPELLIVNRESVTVYGVGVDIDIHAFDYKSKNENSASYEYKDALSEIDRIMDYGYSNTDEPGCLDLLNAVDEGKTTLAAAYLETNITDCYHKVTETHSGPFGSSSIHLTITPLILAAAHGDLSMMQLLLDHNADVNYRGDGSETALMYAVESTKLKAVQLLVDKGAKINVTDDKGYSALDYAEGYGLQSIVNYLKSKGAKSGGRKTK